VVRFKNLAFFFFARLFTDRFLVFAFVEALLLFFFGVDDLDLSEDI